MHDRKLLMKRRTLEGLRRLSPPKGYVLRTYEQTDDHAWARIVARAFQTECSASVFRKEIAEQELFSPERVFFIVHEGQPVGTATAWWRPEFGAEAGYLHMVGVVPEHTGRGLGKVLASAVLRFFEQQGLETAFLHTDDERLAAVKTYLELGFEPVVEDEEVRRRWVEVFRGLRRPDLSHRYCGEE